MKTFIPGQIASASDVNANFKELSDRLTTLETGPETTPWENLRLSTGWSAISGHTPRIRKLNGLVCIEGAVQRNAGGNLSNILTIPAKYQPNSGSQFIGTSTARKSSTQTAPATFYVASGAGNLSVSEYSGIDSGAGWIIPLACTYAPRS
ncbi:hypothetical protein [Schaalia sp. ZJ1691]|uniref:hypothetical protein n=1 Tax=Schaalia sp. ZJ1691 TaxID=2709404 RepID=UPI0013EB8757|nr:hypothetical protein [Schaalia sp. ZJ1691]